ncbi:hypothetical protein KAW64_12760, partial [bacterium]|nr:hypothetical protein [bacterium]
NALNGIVTSLDGIAGRLGACQLDAEINNTPGRVVVCQSPIVVGDQCMAPKDESPAAGPITVSHLLEAVEALRDWALDVNRKLSEYPSTAAIDVASGTSPGL